jgi:carboxyl-terminal processing protease
MKKPTSKTKILLTTIILTVITTGMCLSICLNKLKSDAIRSQELEVFKEALTIVRNTYVEDIPSEYLIHNAIQGMTGSPEFGTDTTSPEQHHKSREDSKDSFMSKLSGTVEGNPKNSDGLKLFTNTFAAVRKNYEAEHQPKRLIYNAIKGMTESLDSHSEFMTPEQYQEMQVDAKGEFGGIGIKLDIREGALTVTGLLDDTPAFRAGIKEGDRIIRIDNDSTKDMTLQDAINRTRGNPSTAVQLSVMRKGWKEARNYTITREMIKISSIKSAMLNEGIGYIKIFQFQKQTASDISVALSDLKQKNMRALVLDLRNNPGGLVYSAVDIVSRFIPSGEIVVYTKNRKGDKKEYRSRENNQFLSVPMTILVNEGSASASEIVAGALKDWQRATLVGTRTYGKGSVQTVVPLQDGSALKLTTAKYYTPKGVSIQTTGILPDIVVTAAIKKGHQMSSDDRDDKQLQSAISFLKSKGFQVPASPAFHTAHLSNR